MRGNVRLNTHNQNTSSLTIIIRYPFHPYYGVELEVISSSRRNDSVVVVRDPAGSPLKVPRWMLSADATQINVSTHAVPSATALIAVAQMLQTPAIDQGYLLPENGNILCECEKRNKGGRRGANELRSITDKAAKTNCARTKTTTRPGRVTVGRDRNRLSSHKGTKR